MVSLDFDLVGSESLEWTEIRSGLLFTAATVDTGRHRLYLARPGELYIADLAAKKPQQELLSSFDESIGFDQMELDRAGNRILATSQEKGSLFRIDLGLDPPVPNLVASNLGPISDMEIFDFDSTVLLIDTTGKRVLEADCPRDADGCSPPEVFGAIPEFEQPISMARAADGRVWVGDLAAQSIFTFDPDGNLLEVLESMSGSVE